MTETLVFIFLVEYLPGSILNRTEEVINVTNIPIMPSLSMKPHKCDYKITEPILKVISNELDYVVVPEWLKHDNINADSDAPLRKKLIREFEKNHNNLKYYSTELNTDSESVSSDFAFDDSKENEGKENLNKIWKIPEKNEKLVAIFETLSNLTAQTCAGLLLAPNWVITAASCVDLLRETYQTKFNFTEKNSYTIIVNATDPLIDGTVHNVTKVLFNPVYGHRADEPKIIHGNKKMGKVYGNTTENIVTVNHESNQEQKINLSNKVLTNPKHNQTVTEMKTSSLSNSTKQTTDSKNVTEKLEDISKIIKMSNETDASKNITDMLSNKTDALSSTTDVLSNKTDALSSTTDVLSNKTDALSSTTDVLSNKTDALSSTTDVLSNKTDALSSTTDVLSNKTDALSSTTDVLSNKTDALSSTTDVLSNKTDALSSTTDVLSNKTDALSSTTDVLSNKTNALSNKKETKGSIIENQIIFEGHPSIALMRIDPPVDTDIVDIVDVDDAMNVVVYRWAMLEDESGATTLQQLAFESRLLLPKQCAQRNNVTHVKELCLASEDVSQAFAGELWCGPVLTPSGGAVALAHTGSGSIVATPLALYKEWIQGVIRANSTKLDELTAK